MTNIFQQVTTAPITNDSSNRSAFAYQQVIDEFEVNVHGRYRADQNLGTKCNIFVGDVMRAMGVPFPTKNELPANDNDGGGDVTQGAARLHSWLNSVTGGQRSGWTRIDTTTQVGMNTLMAHVRAGMPAVASTRDHIAVIRPDQDFESLTPSRLGELIIAQAGAMNFQRGKLSLGWPKSRISEIQFFIHA